MSHADDPQQDLPEGMVDANPAGGFADGDAGEVRSGGDEPPTLAAQEVEDAAARETDAAPGPAPDAEPAADQFVESAEIQQGLDPDIAVHSETSGDEPD